MTTIPGRWVTLICAGLTLTAMAEPPEKASVARKVGPRPGCLSSSPDLKAPSLLELLVFRESYTGCMVRVGGFVTIDWPNVTLYPTREDRASLGMFFGGVGVSFANAKVKIDRDRFDVGARRGFMVVEGRFTMTGPTNATIDEVDHYHFVILPGNGAATEH
jgi:hypothetical protein